MTHTCMHTPIQTRMHTVTDCIVKKGFNELRENSDLFGIINEYKGLLMIVQALPKSANDRVKTLRYNSV